MRFPFSLCPHIFDDANRGNDPGNSSEWNRREEARAVSASNSNSLDRLRFSMFQTLTLTLTKPILTSNGVQRMLLTLRMLARSIVSRSMQGLLAR